MREPQVRRWATQYRRLFKIDRSLRVVAVDVLTDWDGMFYTGRHDDLILINLELCDTEERCRAAILHELIHAEQRSLSLPIDHGNYFRQRAAEIRRKTGINPL